MNNENIPSPSFNFTYSAQQQEEVKAIQQKYLPPSEDKMEHLRRLDRSALRRGTILSITVGIISTLSLGIGMTCTMVWTQFFVLGIVIGILGIIGMCLAYPLYNAVNRRERKKLAPIIMALSEELLGNRKGL